MTDSNIWEVAFWPTTRVSKLPRMVSITRATKHHTPAQRRAVFEKLKNDQPEIAELATKFHQTFGRCELSLDPVTAGQVLAAGEEGQRR